jgi:8-oxo-dGTP pyrophosphatase MutT (NUDIX family)
LVELLGPDRLRSVLLQEPPTELIPGPRAAVASIFRSGDEGTELLFIQRAAKNGDPWSGQMAFPGGRVDPRDAHSFATAERETHEEVGLDLRPAERLGSLGELDGGRANNRLVAVNAHAYWWYDLAPRLTPNHEVAQALWVPLAHLADRGRYIEYIYPATGMPFPGIQLDQQHQVVWGLTLRFLSDLFRRIEVPFIIQD